MEIIVGGHFSLKKRIGAGSFGEIYLGEDIQTKQEVAIKLEPTKTTSPQLFYESKLYLVFASGVSIPRLIWYGVESNYNIMVIDLLGKSLEDLFISCEKKFSLKTVLMIAEQTLSALEYIHNKSFIHRDIKPDNFLIGKNSLSSQIFIIDFGLSKKFREPKTHEHLRFSQGKSLTGTARYASINALKGFEQSRRDDLEALGYVLIYFLIGQLPWQGLHVDDIKKKYEAIRDVKNNTPLNQLCQNLPIEFSQYLDSVRNLDFETEPNYSMYRSLFRNLFIREGYIYDYKYDWCINENQISLNNLNKNFNKKIEIDNRNNMGFPSIQKKKIEKPKKNISKSNSLDNKINLMPQTSSFKRSTFK